jgi:hypothetical protein
MDMHGTPSLEFRDLRVGDTDLRSQCRNAKSAQGRELAGQVRDRPPPQGSKVRVPDRCGLVVVAVRTERLSDPGIALGVTFVAAGGHAVLA